MNTTSTSTAKPAYESPQLQLQLLNQLMNLPNINFMPVSSTSGERGGRGEEQEVPRAEEVRAGGGQAQGGGGQAQGGRQGERTSAVPICTRGAVTRKEGLFVRVNLCRYLTLRVH